VGAVAWPPAETLNAQPVVIWNNDVIVACLVIITFVAVFWFVRELYRMFYGRRK